MTGTGAHENVFLVEKVNLMKQHMKARTLDSMHASKQVSLQSRGKENGIFSHLKTVGKAKTPLFLCLSTAACRLVINKKTVLAYHTVSRGRAVK